MERFLRKRRPTVLKPPMAEPFNPYHKWLGIPARDLPADHYRLLGVERFESDPEVISHAADQRMAHVKSFAVGQHSALSQKILGEIAAARVCLLHPEKKARYDAELVQRAGPNATSEAASGLVLEAEPPSYRSRTRRMPGWVIFLGAALTLGVLAAGVLAGGHGLFASGPGGTQRRSATHAG